MNQYDRKLYDRYKLKPNIYPLIKAISSHPGLSNDTLAVYCRVSGVYIGKLTDKLAELGIIRDVSVHKGRRSWEIVVEEVPHLIRLAEDQRKGI